METVCEDNEIQLVVWHFLIWLVVVKMDTVLEHKPAGVPLGEELFECARGFAPNRTGKSHTVLHIL